MCSETEGYCRNLNSYSVSNWASSSAKSKERDRLVLNCRIWHHVITKPQICVGISINISAPLSTQKKPTSRGEKTPWHIPDLSLSKDNNNQACPWYFRIYPSCHLSQWYGAKTGLRIQKTFTSRPVSSFQLIRVQFHVPPVEIKHDLWQLPCNYYFFSWLEANGRKLK